MQTIGPTFNAYKKAGLNDIWNPVHNMVAAIRYIQSRYGSIFAIDPPVRGYRFGTGRLPEDIYGFGARSGRRYQMHAGEGIVRRNQTIGHQGNVVHVVNNITIDPKNARDMAEVVKLIQGLRTTARQYGAGSVVRAT
jgi:SLT domain-containing protein